MPNGCRCRSSIAIRPSTRSPSACRSSRPYRASKPGSRWGSPEGCSVKRRIVAAGPLRSRLVSLDALAPDQRAVVQLVLQQDRSYEDLAALLGISADAVRERAHRGLERLDPGSDLTGDERAEIADYLLGQQPVSARGVTRSLLT